MTDIVAPPTIDALPPGPRPTDTPAEFDSKGFATIQAQEAMVPQINAAASATHQNAVAANERAVSAASSAATATAQADAAMGYRNTAQSAATTATTKAAEADASAIAASKLNLGDKAAPPTTDNQGGALRAGATYYDTTLPKWRVWSGSAWVEGLSAVAGVSSLNGETGALTKTTLAAYGITDGVRTTSQIANGVSLNTLTTSGFYRLNASHPDAPVPGVGFGQLIVSRGGDTILQIVIGHVSRALHFRNGNPPEVGGSGSWSDWQRVSVHSEIPVSASAGAMNCGMGNHFTANISANTTLSFTNIPAGAYACVLEVNRTAGTLTFPAGTVWTGSVPTLGVGRHLFFFQRAQLGTAGWYVSALTGYAA